MKTNTTLAGAPVLCSDHEDLAAVMLRVQRVALAAGSAFAGDHAGRAYLALLALQDAADRAQHLLASQYSEQVIDALLPRTAAAAAERITCTAIEVDAYEQRLRSGPFSTQNPQPKIENRHDTRA